MLDRILIPLDGSPQAELILGQIGRILRRKDSEITLLRVVDLPDPNRFELTGKIAFETARATEWAEARRYVDELAEHLSDHGVRVVGSVVEGPAATTILDQARRERVGLIAMTTHGRSGLSRWFLGSIAEKVVRSSPIPVLLVRSFRPTPLGDRQPAKPLELPFRKVLIPTDGSPAASTVVGPAGKFAELFNSEIMVLHVELPVVVAGYGEMGPLPVLPPTPSDKDPVTAEMAEQFYLEGLETNRITVTGNPAEQILDQSKAKDVDLIAMATHGRSGFSRWMLGSVAERVLRHAEVPLLLVRAEPAGQITDERGLEKEALSTLK